jgi:hypothetical protein
MFSRPNAGGLGLAAVVTLIAVALSAYWQPDTKTPVTVQAAITFLAAGVTLGRFRPFRRP